MVSAGGLPCAIGELTVRETEDAVLVLGPVREGVPRCLPADEDAVREAVRVDASGRYRPLSGARSLPGDWCVRCQTADEAIAAVEAVYPLAVHHREAWKRGELDIVPLDAVLSRQSGRYGLAKDASDPAREAATAALCSAECMRAPVWNDAQPLEYDIPCPEPCSVLVSLCREAAVWERDGAPEPAAVDDRVAFAAFEQPGNAVRERYLSLRAEMEEEQWSTGSSQERH